VPPTTRRPPLPPVTTNRLRRRLLPPPDCSTTLNIRPGPSRWRRCVVGRCSAVPLCSAVSFRRWWRCRGCGAVVGVRAQWVGCVVVSPSSCPPPGPCRAVGVGRGRRGPVCDCEGSGDRRERAVVSLSPTTAAVTLTLARAARDREHEQPPALIIVDAVPRSGGALGMPRRRASAGAASYHLLLGLSLLLSFSVLHSLLIPYSISFCQARSNGQLVLAARSRDPSPLPAAAVGLEVQPERRAQVLDLSSACRRDA